MTLTVDFDSNPRGFNVPAGASFSVRYVDKSTTTNGVVNTWLWRFNPNLTFTATSSPNIYLTDANLYFAVNDRVMLSTTSALPAGLSSSVVYWVLSVAATYITISLTQGGSVVTYSSAGTGTQYIQMGSDQQNPVVTYRNVSANHRDVTLTVNDSGGTGNTSLLKSNWMTIVTSTFAPPAQNTAFRNITIFVYERSSEAAPKGTCICRAKTAACNLFFTNLQVQGYITKAGKATFDVTNAGGGTVDEIDLFESGTVGRYKNVAIIAGYDVIWSGKITIANKELMSQPGTTPQKATYHCEAYSDIKKLADWNIIAANQTSQVAKSAGQLAALICATNTGEPDFIGTRGGFIDPSGAALQMTLSDTDKLTAFSTLTGATDYDWRTRMETMLFQYATFNGTNLITITSAGLTTNALVGSWILFPTSNYLLSGTSTPNYSGVLAWGRITANDATTITAAVSGAATVPLATDKCLIVQVPRLDFASDLAETTPVRSFTNNLNVVKFTNSDNKDDLFTKVITKGKTTIPEWNLSTLLFTTVPTQVSIPLSAKDSWDSTNNFFNNSTFITQKTEGYVYSYDAASDTIVLYGQGYAFSSGDVILVFGVTTGGENILTTQTITGTPTIQTQLDGTATTTITVIAGNELSTPLIRYGLIVGGKTYFKDTSVLPLDPSWINVGSEVRTYTAGGTHAVYGQYLIPAGVGTPRRIHYPGCLASSRVYSETSPQTGSPVKVHGVITKTLTVDTTTTLPDLEIYACNALLQGSQYYQKSTMTVSYYQFTSNRVRDGVQLTGPVIIREGQRVSIIPATGIAAIERQVIGWEFDASTMTFKLTLGDYIKDVWNSLDKNTSATQKALI